MRLHWCYSFPVLLSKRCSMSARGRLRDSGSWRPCEVQQGLRLLLGLAALSVLVVAPSCMMCRDVLRASVHMILFDTSMNEQSAEGLLHGMVVVVARKVMSQVLHGEQGHGCYLGVSSGNEHERLWAFVLHWPRCGMSHEMLNFL